MSPRLRRPFARVVEPRAAALALVACLASGCLSRAALHTVVLEYDETVSRSQAEMLLVNVARARHGRPLHFTTVSGIAATFDFRTEASVGGELAENPGISILTPSLGFGVSEAPTISIVPIQGEEFTRRLLTPLDESILGFFYHQGVDADVLLPLVVHGLIVETDSGRRLLPNAHDADGGGEAFDRALRTVSELARAQRLEVGPLVFEESWPLASASAPAAADLAGLVERGYDFRSSEEGGLLVRRVVGRQVLTNYDPATLSNAERVEMQRRAQEYPSYFVYVDLRPGGGVEGLRGWIKLRSLTGILDAIAASIVPPHDTGSGAPLRVLEADGPVPESLFEVRYEHRRYAVPRDDAGRNAAAFGVLYRLYQMTVAEVPGAAVPSVTIAK